MNNNYINPYNYNYNIYHKSMMSHLDVLVNGALGPVRAPPVLPCGGQGLPGVEDDVHDPAIFTLVCCSFLSTK